MEIAGSLSPTLGKAAEEASKSLEGINLKAVAVGAGVAAAGAAIGKATIEAGKYLVDLGGQFDDVVDTIRIVYQRQWRTPVRRSLTTTRASV